MKKGFFTLGLVLPNLVFANSWQQAYSIHILKEGETLSGLLHAQNYKPLYGRGNWVEKILDINHLTTNQAKEIKKGYPIILPKRKDAIALMSEDKVSLKQASTLYYGLVGNRISKHQDVFIDLSFFESSGKVSNYNIKQQSNVKLGLTYQDKNYRQLGGLQYNPEFALYGIGYGPTEFTNQKDLSASFGPTVLAQTALMFKTKKLPYSFGPYLQAMEQSSLDLKDEEVTVRRDQLVNIGAMAKQTYEINNLRFLFRGSIGATVLSHNLNGLNNLNLVTTRFSADVNLTRDYYIGAFFKNDNYSGSAQKNSNAIGLNLKYFVK